MKKRYNNDAMRLVSLCVNECACVRVCACVCECMYACVYITVCACVLCACVLCACVVCVCLYMYVCVWGEGSLWDIIIS